MGRKIALVLAIIACMGPAFEIAQAIPACSGDACKSFQIKVISLKRDQKLFEFSVINLDHKRAIQFVGCVTDLKDKQVICGWQFEGVVEAGHNKDFSGPLTMDPNIGGAMKTAVFRNDDTNTQIEELEKERAALTNCQNVTETILPLCCAVPRTKAPAASRTPKIASCWAAPKKTASIRPATKYSPATQVKSRKRPQTTVLS